LKGILSLLPGPDSSFNDLKLVIDNRTYTGIEGRWRDLFNRMKASAGTGAATSASFDLLREF
jgi:hypothetical protein